MKKRVLGAMLLAGFAVLSMGVCASADDIYEVVMEYPTLGDTPQDLQLVEDAINEITEDEIGVHVTLYPVNCYDLNSTTSLMVSSGEKLDLAMCMFEGGAQSYVNKGMLLELDELFAEYGADIAEAEGVAMAGGYYNGTLYTIPTEDKMGRVKALACRKDILDKYGIEYDEEKVYTLQELTEIFAIVKEGEGEKFYCVAANASEDAPYTYFSTADLLGSDYTSGVLENYGVGTTDIVNYFASEAFAEYCETMREWFVKGYFSSDCNTTTDSALTQWQSGNYLGCFVSAEPDMVADYNLVMDTYFDTEVVMLYVTDPASRTQDYQVTQWMIPITCDNPEKTMEFLNLMYASEEIVNLLRYGIEDVHYQHVEGTEKVIEYLDGVTADTVTYLNVLNVWGDKLKDYVMSPNDDTFYETMQAFNEGIAEDCTSDALGYTFNSDPVKTQYAAVADVVSQYSSVLGYGVVEWETALEEFLSALDAAGIGDVIAENQSQFDAWLAAQE